MVNYTAMSSSNLPVWNLDDLYSGPDSPQLKDDLDRAATDADDFADRYKGRLAKLDGPGLAAAIISYERISEAMDKAISYAQLVFAANTGDPETGRFYQGIQERVTDISSVVLFFTLEINRLDEDLLADLLEDEKAARYRPWISDLRAFRPHQLPDEQEKLLHQKALSGRLAWVRLFEETFAQMRFDVDGKELSLSETLNLLSDSDGTAREKAAHALASRLADNGRLLSLITNTMAKDKETEDNWRKYPRPVSERNLDNRVEDEVVDALVAAVSDAYPRLSHRYYRLKAEWFGQDKLNYWDRNAPLPDDDDEQYSWDRARELVIDAYGGFDLRMADIARQFFDKGWIDAELRQGKDSGAFSHSTVPSVHPYILLNFHGKTRDVMTLAHELGHGVHQVLAAPQGALMASTPLTLAETASVFGEMLAFRSLLNGGGSPLGPDQRRILLAGKVEDMLNTVVRQISFHQFETRLHDERRSGELSADRLGELWMESQRQSLGPAIDLDHEYRNFWGYIPHFVHTPFYVYAYAFGDCLVNSLYHLYQDGHPDFATKYMQMLSAGGTLRHRELLAPFGLDASDPAFWNRGLKVIEGFIDELES